MSVPDLVKDLRIEFLSLKPLLPDGSKLIVGPCLLFDEALEMYLDFLCFLLIKKEAQSEKWIQIGAFVTDARGTQRLKEVEEWLNKKPLDNVKSCDSLLNAKYDQNEDVFIPINWKWDHGLKGGETILLWVVL